MSYEPIASDVIVMYYCEAMGCDVITKAAKNGNDINFEKQMIQDSPYLEYPNCYRLLVKVYCECGEMHNVRLA